MQNVAATCRQYGTFLTREAGPVSPARSARLKLSAAAITTRPMPDANFHIVYMAAEILAVECKVCGGGSSLDRRTCRLLHQGKKTELTAGPLPLGHPARAPPRGRAFIP